MKLELKLAYYDVRVQHVNHYATETSSLQLSVVFRNLLYLGIVPSMIGKVHFKFKSIK